MPLPTPSRPEVKMAAMDVQIYSPSITNGVGVGHGDNSSTLAYRISQEHQALVAYGSNCFFSASFASCPSLSHFSTPLTSALGKSPPK